MQVTMFLRFRLRLRAWLWLFCREQGSAAAFLEDVERVAEESHFSPEQGFLGGLVEIAREVRSAEEAATQVLQRAGSGRYTKRGK